MLASRFRSDHRGTESYREQQKWYGVFKQLTENKKHFQNLLYGRLEEEC